MAASGDHDPSEEDLAVVDDFLRQQGIDVDAAVSPDAAAVAPPGGRDVDESAAAAEAQAAADDDAIERLVAGAVGADVHAGDEGPTSASGTGQEGSEDFAARLQRLDKYLNAPIGTAGVVVGTAPASTRDSSIADTVATSGAPDVGGAEAAASPAGGEVGTGAAAQPRKFTPSKQVHPDDVDPRSPAIDDSPALAAHARQITAASPPRPGGESVSSEASGLDTPNVSREDGDDSRAHNRTTESSSPRSPPARESRATPRTEDEALLAYLEEEARLAEDAAAYRSQGAEEEETLDLSAIGGAAQGASGITSFAFGDHSGDESEANVGEGAMYTSPAGRRGARARGAGDDSAEDATRSKASTSPDSDTSGSASSPGASPGEASAAWHTINRMLQESMVTPVTLVRGDDGQPAAKESSVLTTLRELLVLHRRRGDSLQQLTMELDAAQSGRGATDDVGDSDARRKIVRRAAAAERRERVAEEELQSDRKKAAEQIKRLKRANNDLRQVEKQLKHRIKAMESESQRMRHQLASEAKRQKATQARTRAMFRKIQGRDMRPSSSVDAKVLGVVAAYEEQRQALTREVEFLRAEVSRLNDEVRDRENFIGEKSRTNQWHMRTAAQAREAARLETARRELDSRNTALAQAEMVLETERLRMKEEREQRTTETETLLSELESLKVELDARPTPRDWKDAQRRIRQLERKVAAAVDLGVSVEEMTRRADAAERELMAQRRTTATSALMARDRAMHDLQLHRLDALPRETTLDVLKEICVELGVSEPAAIGPSLRKMKRVVGMVPSLEAFCKDVVTFVLLNTSDSNPESRAIRGSAMRRVLPTLQSWVSQLRQLSSLVRLRDEVAAALAERRFGVPAPGSARGGDGSSGGPNRDPHSIVAAVRELVKLETGVFDKKEMFDAAEAAMEADPSVLINRIVLHFQQLFDVGTLEGVFPKLNQLFLFTNEMKNLQTVLRSMLGIEEQCSVPHLLSAVRAAIHGGTRSSEGKPTSIPAMFDETVPAGEPGDDDEGGQRATEAVRGPGDPDDEPPLVGAAPAGEDVWAGDSDEERKDADRSVVPDFVVQKRGGDARGERNPSAKGGVAARHARPGARNAGGVRSSSAGLAWVVPE